MPTHCWRDYKVVQPFWRKIWKFLKGPSMKEHRIEQIAIQAKEKKEAHPHKELRENAHISNVIRAPTRNSPLSRQNMLCPWSSSSEVNI